MKVRARYNYSLDGFIDSKTIRKDLIKNKNNNLHYVYMFGLPLNQIYELSSKCILDKSLNEPGVY